MTARITPFLKFRSTDSDVRCSLLLAAVRAFQEAAAASEGEAGREAELLAEFAEPVVVPDPPGG
jgi:hypothetical protein